MSEWTPRQATDQYGNLLFDEQGQAIMEERQLAYTEEGDLMLDEQGNPIYLDELEGWGRQPAYDENNLPILDANGNQMYLDQFDEQGNVIEGYTYSEAPYSYDYSQGPGILQEAAAADAEESEAMAQEAAQVSAATGKKPKDRPKDKKGQQKAKDKKTGAKAQKSGGGPKPAVVIGALLTVGLLAGAGYWMSQANREPPEFSTEVQEFGNGQVDTEFPSSTPGEQPIAAQPVTEEPVTEEPVTEQPVTEQPVTEQPVTEPAPVATRPPGSSADTPKAGTPQKPQDTEADKPAASPQPTARTGVKDPFKAVITTGRSTSTGSVTPPRAAGTPAPSTEAAPVVTPVTPPMVTGVTPAPAVAVTAPSWAAPTPAQAQVSPAPVRVPAVTPAPVAVRPVMPAAPAPSKAGVSITAPSGTPVAITPVRPANQAEQVIIGMDLEYLGLVSSGDRQEAMFNSIYGAVSGEVGQQLPGTDITLQSADDQKAVFTMKGMKYTVFLNVPESHSAP